jgi:glycosyltransferase involved in cell wall biosynthesis
MKRSAKISFLVPDVSSPVLGPVTVLGRILQEEYDVEIVGPDLGHGICAMYRNSFPYRAIPAPRLYRLPDFAWQARRIGRALEGDLIVAVKAYADTIPVALWQKWCRGKKAVAYLDEWDGALVRMRPRRQRWAIAVRNLHHPLEDSWYPWVEKLIPRLDSVWSTTTYLQRKFGGHIVHMGVDTEFFSAPNPDATAALKKDLGLEKGRHIVFGGVVRPHKGIELILDALAIIGNPAYRLLIVGPRNSHVEALLSVERYRPHLVSLGSRPKEEMPRYLALADAIVLPLSDNLLARSQMPCKVFEAMSMAKPIIASAVSDLPLVLEGCGRIVPPDDAASLAQAIESVFSDPRESGLLGSAAREKCIREYSHEATRRTLLNIVGELLA